jgi:hypothetical protein
MSYAVALVLMLLSVLLLLAGFVSDSSAAFVMAAAASAGAVVLLAVRVKRRQPKTFVTDAPPQVRPAWLGSKRGANNESVVDVTDAESLPVELEIDHVIDGYRTLLASEILPMLETLSADELRKVVHVETTGRNREAIIQRANHLIDLIEGRRSARSGAKRKTKTGVRSRLGVGRKAQAVIDPEAPDVPENAGVSVAEPEKPKRQSLLLRPLLPRLLQRSRPQRRPLVSVWQHRRLPQML